MRSKIETSKYIHEYDYKKQKTIKPAIEVLAEQLMEDNAKKDFFTFVDYIKQQKMTLPWFVTNSYNIIYKGCKIAQIYIYDGKDIQNCWRIKINTASKDTFDILLNGLSDEVTGLFSENFNKKCTACNNCAPGETFDFAGKHYENVCNGSNGVRIFLYRNPNSDQIEEIKKLINIRKDFCIKMKSMGINPGT